MNKPLTLFLAITLALCGCVTPPPKRIVDRNTVTPLTGQPPLPVRCVPAIWDRVEELRMMGMPFQFSTGEVFTTAFNGTKAGQPVLEIVDSSLTGKITDLGFTGLVTYKVKIAVTANGTRHEYSAEYTYSTHGFDSPATQVKIAVETAVADLYKQVKLLL